MMVEEQIPPGVTPIKRATKHQEKEDYVYVDEKYLKKHQFRKYDIFLSGHEVQVFYNGEDEVIIDGKRYHAKILEEDGYTIVMGVNAGKNDTHSYRVDRYDGNVFLESRQLDFRFQPSVPKLNRRSHSQDGTYILQAPLPGSVVEILVKVGDVVDIGDKLLVLEAMKMQNDILSDFAGKITEINITKGSQVTNNQKLLIIRSIAEKKE